MTLTPTPPEFPKRRWAWVWLAAVGLAVLGIVAAIQLARERRRAGRAEIDQRLAAIRTTGEPVTVDDLIRRYPSPPPERDAALLLAPALAQLIIPADTRGIPWLGETGLPNRTMPMGSGLIATLEDLSLANHDALTTALAINLEGAWVDIGLNADFSLDAQRTRNLRKLPLLLLLKAVWAAEEGQSVDAVIHLQQGLAVGRVFRSGVLLHHLTRRGIEQHACNVLERLVNQAELSETALRSLEPSLAQEQEQGLREAVLEIRCRDIWLLEQLRANPVESLVTIDYHDTRWTGTAKSWSKAALLAWSDQGYRDLDFVQIIETWAKMVSALGQTPSQRQSEVKAIDDEILGQQRRGAVAWSFTGPRLIFDRIEQDTGTIARLRTARTALAVLRWRAAHGNQFPESLAELVPDTLPAIPADPFDEQPLRYLRMPQGFTVYSVGPDLTDNGGREKPTGTEKPEGYDMGFTVGR